MAIIGKRETEAGEASIREHGRGNIGSMTISDLAEKIRTENPDPNVRRISKSF